MFLGSNSVRHLNAAVFSHWPYLEYLTLENIIVDDVAACLELIGKQLKGLKIQCAGKKNWYMYTYNLIIHVPIRI